MTTTKTRRKRDQNCGYQRQRVREEELEACGQKVQTFGCKINKYWGVMYKMINIINISVCYVGKLLRE